MQEGASYWDAAEEKVCLQHTATDRDAHVRAYFKESMPITKCHEDVQAGKSRGNVLRYVATYTPKFSDAFAKEWKIQEKQSALEVKRLCHEIDADGNGTISWEEFEVMIHDKRVRAYFAMLDLDVKHAEQFFLTLSDKAESCNVGIDFFVEGCMMMKGKATSIDLHMLSVQLRVVEKHQKEFFAYCIRGFESMGLAVHELRRTPPPMPPRIHRRRTGGIGRPNRPAQPSRRPRPRLPRLPLPRHSGWTAARSSRPHRWFAPRCRRFHRGPRSRLPWRPRSRWPWRHSRSQECVLSEA